MSNCIAIHNWHHRKPGVDKANSAGETRLMRAVVDDNVDLIRKLLEDGADPTIKDNAGWAPIHESANPEVTKLLLLAEVCRRTLSFSCCVVFSSPCRPIVILSFPTLLLL